MIETRINQTIKNKRIFAPLWGCLNIFLLTAHTVFWCLPMYVFFILKLLSSHPKWRKCMNTLLVGTANLWIQTNNRLMKHNLNIQWDIPNLDNLKMNDWYFIICNHQSWTDILILQKIFLNKIPFIRFFIKKELMWFPFLNISWWAYDFPIMHRHSKEAFKKHPELKEKDFQATQKACQIYQNYPVTILNFLEGTRFTSNKRIAQQSPYHHLLIPKTGGFAYAVNSMAGKINQVLDVTIIYPENTKSFWDFLCGRIEKIIIDVRQREIPETLLGKSHLDYSRNREIFKEWIHSIWQEKDELMGSLSEPD